MGETDVYIIKITKEAAERFQKEQGGAWEQVTFFAEDIVFVDETGDRKPLKTRGNGQP